jgi:hypothetical protein
MRLYGEANNVRGLATGPIETRFARLRENTGADMLIVWTTPGRWAAGEGLSLRFPELHLEFACSLADGHLIANKVAQVPEDARPPDREPGAVGVVVHPERIPLPPEDFDDTESDPGVEVLEGHFAKLADRRWGGFTEPLSAALEAEAKDDEERTQRLTVPFKDATLAHGGEEDVWRLKGVTAEALRALDDGEWLEVLDEQGRSRTSARVIDSHPSASTLVVGIRTASDPPRSGYVRPRSRRKILEQKRALLEELASPTGSLPNLVRLVAAPASMPAPRPIRPIRFVNQAVMRNRSQARAVALALGLDEGQALLIQGPPGTGKSTTAAEIDVQLILRDPGVKILVCSHSNHGTDNMLMKVLPFLDDASERIARIGFYERVAKEARPYYASADADLGDRNIIFTTIDALVLQDIAGARLYDYVIVDEANRAGVLDSLLALARGKRMIMVGDPMQLQPVMSEAEQQMVAASAAAANGGSGRNGRNRNGRQPIPGVAQPGAQNVIGKSLFAWIQERHFAPAAAVLLDQQNRMHPAIGELVSRVFYSNRVRTGPAAPRRGTGMPAFPSPVSWVDTRSLRGNVESRAGGTSLFNVAEARLVTSITRHLASHAPPNLSIGVITAYAEQRDLLRRLMGPHDWPPDRQLEIDTVDAFEGREKDIIVLSLVRANRRRDVGFLRLEQRLNVAISRSRRLLIVVGDTSTLRGGYFNNLVASCQSIGQVIPAPKLIGQFLSRGGQRRMRFDERRRDAMAAGAEDVAGAAAMDAASDAIDAVLDAADAGIATVSNVGVEPVQREHDGAPAPTSARRRRRRAWERRRERLRALHEQDEAATASEGPASEDEEEAGLGEPALEVLELAELPEPTPLEEPDRPRQRRRRRRGKEVPTDFVVQPHLPEPEPELEADSEPEPEPMPIAEVAPRRRGRPRKVVAEPVEEALPIVEEPVAFVEEVIAEPLPIVEEAPAPKRRGRPPKVKAEVVEVVEVIPVTPIAAEEPAPKRRPGRPRKAPRTEPVAEPVVEPVPQPVVEFVAAAEVPPKRRPGRPRKTPVEPVPVEPVAVEVIEVVPEPEAPPKRRPGRPRKVAISEVPAPAPQPEPEPITPVRRTRARRTTP